MKNIHAIKYSRDLFFWVFNFFGVYIQSITNNGNTLPNLRLQHILILRDIRKFVQLLSFLIIVIHHFLLSFKHSPFFYGFSQCSNGILMVICHQNMSWGPVWPMIQLDARVIKWYLPKDSLTIFDYLFIIIGF